MAKTGFESMPELPVIAQSAHEGDEEKKRKISPSEEHVGSCQHRRGEEERNQREGGEKLRRTAHEDDTCRSACLGR